ncbi:MAG TPA: DUF4230 domain-containing protein, partial [Labilithrix sp.]|nr:DUF4230 domain-containing protein [Labilithrix sp.]
YLRTATPPSASSELRVEHEGATIVRELRELARLETSSLHVEKVIELVDHQKRLRGVIEADDALLYVAVGEVVLGVDLSKLGESDVRSDKTTNVAYVDLPPPEILTVRFDEARSHVYSRRTDVLAKRNEGLEGAARREALAAFEAAGKDARAVSVAKAQAERQLRALARAWGVKELVVGWKGAAGEVSSVSSKSQDAVGPGR